MSGAAFFQTVESLLPIGVRFCLASFVVMFATWLVVTCFHNRSAAMRHRMLTLGLVGV